MEELASQIGATAVVVCDHRKELLCAGQPSVAVHCRSIRKTLLGALFGRHVASGAIELDATLADLGIDDSVPPSLTGGEWSARVRDLLTCRPGIYHPSNHQGEAARAALPPRGAHRPGSYFLYNNWDFNALGTIFERAIGQSMFTEFAQAIAGPSGMRHFDPPASDTPPRAGHSDTPPRAGHSTALTLPHLRPRPGTLRPAPPQPRRVRHAQRDPGRLGSLPAPPSHPTGRGPAYGYLWWVEHHGQLFHRHHGPRRIIGRLRHGRPVPTGHTRHRPGHRAARRPAASRRKRPGLSTGPPWPNWCTTPPTAQSRSARCRSHQIVPA